VNCVFCDAVEMRSSSSFVSSYLFVSGGVWSLLLGLGMTIPSLTGSYQSVPFLEALLSSITQALASSLIRLVAAANNCISRPVSCGLYQPSSIQVTNFALHLSPLYPELCCFPDDSRACQATLRDTGASRCNIKVYAFGPNDC